jgi:hypothetical protein|tara:strand:+ start:1918 stop:3030 length:1113 start_codon:yes stop_codon:yes gene_type:complete
MLKKYMAGKIIKTLVKKKGRPKVDKRKTKAKRKAQSKARQAKFQQSEAAKAEAQGTTKTKLAEKRSVERKAETIRGKDIDGRTKTLAIRLVEDNPKLTADQAIKKAKNVDKTKIQKVMSMARKDTARMKRKGLLSGLSEEQMKERKRLISQKLKEMKNEGKTKTVISSRTLSLTPEGERIIKQKGGIDKIIAESGPTGTKKNKYLYEGANEALPAKGGGIDTKGKTGKEASEIKREAYQSMTKGEKLEFIRKQFARGYTNSQLADIMYKPKTASQKKAKASIIQRMKTAKNQGYPFKTQRERGFDKKSFDDIMKSFGAGKGTAGIVANTPVGRKTGGKVGMYKSGKQIKSGPRGCGVALRGFGKAMKGKR